MMIGDMLYAMICRIFAHEMVCCSLMMNQMTILSMAVREMAPDLFP